MNMIIANPPRRKARPVAKKTRRRKWGSPKQRAALRKMLAANPNRRRSARRKARRRARHNPPAGVPVMAKRRSRRTARVFRKARRRARSGLGGLGKFLPAGTLNAVAGGTAGFVGVNMLTGKLTDRGIIPASLATGPARIAVKGVLAILAGYLGRRFAGRSLGNAIGIGGLTAVALDTVNLALNHSTGISGYSPGGDNNYAQLAGSGDQDGMGDYQPELAGDGVYA